jgi:hypothetical protein
MNKTAMASQFNPEKVLAKINDIENLFPVNDWVVNNVKVWPYIRTALAYTQNKNPDTRHVISKSRIDKIKKILTLLRVAVTFPFDYLRLKRRLKTSTRIFIGAVTHRTNIDGLLFNRYFDLPIDEFRDQNINSIAIDSNFILDKSKYYNNSCLFSLPALYIIVEVKRRLSFRKNVHKVNLPCYSEFLEYVATHFDYAPSVRAAFSEPAIIKRICLMYDRKRFLESLLVGTAVTHIYFLCYYSSLFYPLIAACNSVNIATIDVQHGGIGEGHYSYGRWNHVPKDGYQLLPRFFWTWDRPSAEMINKWATKTDFHSAHAAGNPWTDACFVKYRHEPVWKNYILLNMTTVTLDPFVIKAIRHFGDRKKWVLRMHPRQFQHSAQLQRQINEEGVAHVVQIEDSREVPLPISLKFSERFISKASGSVIEAIELGLQPILLRSEMMSYYQHYVDSGEVAVLLEDNEIFLIEQLEKKSNNQILQDQNRNASSRFLTFESSVLIAVDNFKK